MIDDPFFAEGSAAGSDATSRSSRSREAEVPQQSRARARCCSLRLLGRWQLVADGEDVVLGHREERLTALLGLTGQSSRVHVAGTLWPASTDPRELASLRSAVSQPH